MTVQQLIDELRKYHPDIPVETWHGASPCGGWTKVGEVCHMRALPDWGVPETVRIYWSQE